MARKDTRSYAERKARGRTDSHRLPSKSIRAPQELWDLATDKARDEGLTLNGYLRRLLAEDVGQPQLGQTD